MAYTLKMNEKEERFLQWLTANGAKLDKLQWPVEIDGMRGVVALEDIETDEPMLHIPASLIINPPKALADPVIGECLLAEHISGDTLLAIYLCYELSKGEESFFYPFLQMLPQPDVASGWKPQHLDLLEDEALILRSKNRRFFLKRSYQRWVLKLNKKYPEIFKLEEYSFERYRYSWEIIESRAFGKRLPWSALVPFADCLNHTNVQTKYALEESSQCFILFPTGSNHYKKGSQVFNSYGRRANDNLLLDYGFSMLHNVWDEVEIGFQLPHDDSKFTDRTRLLNWTGFSTIINSAFTSFRFPHDALAFLRIVVSNEYELELLYHQLQDTNAAYAAIEEDSAAMLDENVRSHLVPLIKPTSIRCELLCIKLLIEKLEFFLKNKCSTTIDEDKDLLEILKNLTPPYDESALDELFHVDNKSYDDNIDRLELSFDYADGQETPTQINDVLSSKLSNIGIPILNFRITRKQIIIDNIKWLKVFEKFVQYLLFNKDLTHEDIIASEHYKNCFALMESLYNFNDSLKHQFMRHPRKSAMFTTPAYFESLLQTYMDK